MIAIDKRSSDPHVLWEEYWSKERVHRPYENKLSLNETLNPNFVRIVCISDTHSQLDKVVSRIPDGDILVHCGDFTNNGELEEIQQFDSTIGQLPHKHKIVVAGNHELGFDDTENLELRQRKSRGLGTPKGYEHLKNCTILHDKAVKIYGLNIYGSSWHPLEGYSFSCTRGDELASKWSKIPTDTDILLTHTPPLGHMDIFKDGQHWGCAELLNAVEQRVKPKLHVFGHVHERNGMTTNGVTVFANASICSHSLNPRYNPIIFDLPLPEGYSKD